MSDIQQDSIRTDGELLSLLYNSKTGMGSSRDPSSYTSLNLPGILQEGELRILYQSSWFFPRIVDTISNDATKQDWLNIKIVDGDEGDVKKVEAKLRAIAFRPAVRRADQLARLFGGAVIFIEANKNRDVDKPLTPDSVRSIERLRVLDRYQIRPALGENVLDPEYYQLSISSRDGINDSKGQQLGFEQRIHKSRVIRFYGNPLPPIDLSQNEGWGLSVIQGIYEPFKRYYEGGQILGQILRTMSTLNLSMSNLGELIAAGKSDDVKAHYKEVSMMVSVFNTLLTDSSLENASYLSRSMAGAPEAIEKFKEELTAASNYPYYKIWGEVGKAGLSDTGGAESEAYAQHVSQYQDDHYAPGVEFFLPLVMKTELGKVPDDWEASFNSIYKLSQTAQTDNDSKVASTNKTLFDAGVIKTEEWRRSVSSGQPIANVIEISAGEADNKEEAIPQVYNGAQITAVVDIVKAIAGGEIPRDTGVAIVAKALAVPLKEAEEIVGSAGKQADGSQSPTGFNPNEFQGGLEDGATTDTPPTDAAAPETPAETPPASDTPPQDGAPDVGANPAEQASTTGEQLSVDAEDDYDRFVRWDAAEGEWVFLHEEMRSDSWEGVGVKESLLSIVQNR